MQSVPITTNVARCTRYNIMWWNLSVTCGRSVVSSTNNTDRHDIAKLFLREALNSITQPNPLIITEWHVNLLLIYRCYPVNFKSHFFCKPWTNSTVLTHMLCPLLYQNVLQYPWFYILFYFLHLPNEYGIYDETSNQMVTVT